MNAISIRSTKKVEPKCYAYTTPEVQRHEGWTKIGYTEQDDLEACCSARVLFAGEDGIAYSNVHSSASPFCLPKTAGGVCAKPGVPVCCAYRYSIMQSRTKCKYPPMRMHKF